MEEHVLQYESKLQFMFDLIGSQSQTSSAEHGMTALQAEFWRVVWECKERINSDPKHLRAPTAVREFYLEVEVWGTFWDENSFPGKYPVPVYCQPATPNQPTSDYEALPPLSSVPSCESSVARTSTSQSSVHQASIPRGPAAFSSTIQQYTAYTAPQNFVPTRAQLNALTRNLLPTFNSTQQPSPRSEIQPASQKPVLTTYLRNLARQVIFSKKGYNFVPRHGWDRTTNLPMYSIICFANNGFQAFCGEYQQLFYAIKEAFSTFCVMFQKIQRGFMIIWLEARTFDQTIALGNNSELWKAFQECWAFLKSWASQLGDAIDVVTYLENYAGDAEAEEEADKLMPPPHPAWV